MRPRSPGDPAPLPCLHEEADQAEEALDLDIEVLLLTEPMRKAGQTPNRLSLGCAKDISWTAAQLVADHNSNGYHLRQGPPGLWEPNRDHVGRARASATLVRRDAHLPR